MPPLTLAEQVENLSGVDAESDLRRGRPTSIGGAPSSLKWRSE
jgi:hypothetical protein